MRIKSPKNFWAAWIYLVLGIATIVIARDYPMGSATRMGPAYFPTLLGILLSLVGVIALIRSLHVDGSAVGPIAWRKLLLITASIALFGALVRDAGLVPALIVLVVLGAMASDRFHWGAALALAAGLAGFSALVFVKILGIPLPLIGPWLVN